MDIRLINKETAESLISKAYRETKKYLKILNTSEDEMFKVFMDKKPALVKAAKDYIRFTNKFSSNEVDDVLEEFTVLSKNLIKAFDFYDITQSRDWITDAFIFGKKTPLFLAMECIFNVSIFREQGIQRRFTNLYNISKNIFEFKEGEYFLYAKPHIYYVDAYRGRILKCKKQILDFEGFDGDCYNVYYNAKKKIYDDRMLVGYWVDAVHNKKSGGKNGTVYKYVNFSGKEYIDTYGGKTFDVPAHQVIMLCWYGLNAMKFCIGSGSLLTIDHIDGDAFNNSIFNLAMISRVANAKKGGGDLKAVNFLQLFHLMDICHVPISYSFY